MVEGTAGEASRPVGLVPLMWGTWAIGPGSFGLAFVFYVLVPEWYYGYSDPGPDLGLACIMVLTHLVAGASTLLLLLARGSHRRLPELWVLLVYWLGIAGWLMPGLLLARDRSIGPTIRWISVISVDVSLVAAVLMPIVGIVRVAMRSRSRARPNQAPPNMA